MCIDVEMDILKIFIVRPLGKAVKSLGLFFLLTQIQNPTKGNIKCQWKD